MGGMKRILLIDDCMIQLQVLNGLLKDSYEVIMASSGVDGVSIARKKKPDLIIMDYDMPVISGKETLGRLREHAETKNIPTIFLTGVDERKEIEAVLRLQPQGYLLKPVRKERLFETIQAVLGR